MNSVWYQHVVHFPSMGSLQLIDHLKENGGIEELERTSEEILSTM